MRPKSEIYIPKRYDEHPHPFHMQSPPPREEAIPVNQLVRYLALQGHHVVVADCLVFVY